MSRQHMQALAASREVLEFDARLCFLTGMQIIYVAFWTELGPAHFAADTMTTPAWGTAGAESQARYILDNVCWTACHILHAAISFSACSHHSTSASCMSVNLGQLEQQYWIQVMEGLHACLLQPHICQAFGVYLHKFAAHAFAGMPARPLGNAVQSCKGTLQTCAALLRILTICQRCRPSLTPEGEHMNVPVQPMSADASVCWCASLCNTVHGVHMLDHVTSMPSQS